jgi:hypothetical protein
MANVRAQGIHGVGSTEYTPAQKAVVVEALKRLTADGAVVNVQTLNEVTGVAGMTIRYIISEADGVDFLLGGNGIGYQMARDAAEATRLSQRFTSQVKKMSGRIQRRRQMTRKVFPS